MLNKGKALILAILVSILMYAKSEKADYSKQDSWPGNCNKGTMQSPIEFTDSISYRRAEGHVHFMAVEYHPLHDVKVEFMDTGHFGVRFNKKGEYGCVKIEIADAKIKYDLAGIVFHHKAEHKARGIEADLEMQLIHKIDKNYVHCNPPLNEMHENCIHKSLQTLDVLDNEYLIISVLFKIDKEKSNPDITRLHVCCGGKIDGFDINHYVSKYESYYFYRGSFTMPPCRENVNWVIYEHLFPIGEDQINDFVKVLFKNGYTDGNRRKFQDLNNREVFYHSLAHSKEGLPGHMIENP